MACFVGAVQRKFTQRHGTRYKLFRFAAEYSLDQGAIPISAVKDDRTGGRATPAQGEPDAIRQTGEIGIATPTHLLQAIYVCSHGDCIQFGQPGCIPIAEESACADQARQVSTQGGDINPRAEPMFTPLQA